MSRTVVIAGASGFLGRHLKGRFEQDGVRVRTIGRGAAADADWSDDAHLAAVLDGTDLLVNLAGRSVSCRYTKRTADEIFSSRVQTTAALGRALAACAAPPQLWVNASTGTIYRDSRDRPMDEPTGEIGTGFSVAVAQAWERTLFESPAPVRKVALRMSIILGPGGGAVNPLIDLARVGLGGHMGDGGQVFSWAHADDVLGAVEHLVAHPEISGPVNVATDDHVTNAELMAQVRAAVGRRRGVPTPAWLLELGARVIRTEPELVLKSRWVDPRVLRESGYAFVHPTLAGALDDVVAGSPRGLLPVQLG
ncbi:TIGR01777 family oxidoreductase [Aeromicrobium sp. IC_218]|uniref:TIGR01777 family oxidoreductase n=1 Tax=Aeromicrobium sp. IC_218 TaxID=2545468 RepID=UPI00103B78FA|nr:TIGR01777 family oxidoreductase [Aeromicrobium sp. IC_218]TCI96298.1 TIGR01777 family protein [Aeromicrobium sp. IC_218]